MLMVAGGRRDYLKQAHPTTCGTGRVVVQGGVCVHVCVCRYGSAEERIR